jgi:hypothetical protein
MTSRVPVEGTGFSRQELSLRNQVGSFGLLKVRGGQAARRGSRRSSRDGG